MHKYKKEQQGYTFINQNKINKHKKTEAQALKVLKH